MYLKCGQDIRFFLENKHEQAQIPSFFYFSGGLIKRAHNPKRELCGFLVFFCIQISNHHIQDNVMPTN